MLLLLIIMDQYMNSISLNMHENVSKYDLYIPNKFRVNMFIDLDKRLYNQNLENNNFEMLYKLKRDSYENLVENMKIKKNMLFIGFSNYFGVFIKSGGELINQCNNNLRSNYACPYNSSIVRVIITSSEKVRYPTIEPLKKNCTFKFQPNFSPPKNNIKKKNKNVEKHMSVYYVDHPKRFYYPRDNKIFIYK